MQFNIGLKGKDVIKNRRFARIVTFERLVLTRASALKSAFLPFDRNEAKNARQLLLFQTRKTAKVFISCLVFLALLNEKEFAKH